jgi:hypothetical protein
LGSESLEPELEQLELALQVVESSLSLSLLNDAMA